MHVLGKMLGHGNLDLVLWGFAAVSDVDGAVRVNMVVAGAGDVLPGGRFEAKLVALPDQADEAHVDVRAGDQPAVAVHQDEGKAVGSGEHFVDGEEDADPRVGGQFAAGGKPNGECRGSKGQHAEQPSS